MMGLLGANCVSSGCSQYKWFALWSFRNWNLFVICVLDFGIFTGCNQVRLAIG